MVDFLDLIWCHFFKTVVREYIWQQSFQILRFQSLLNCPINSLCLYWIVAWVFRKSSYFFDTRSSWLLCKRVDLIKYADFKRHLIILIHTHCLIILVVFILRWLLLWLFWLNWFSAVFVKLVLKSKDFICIIALRILHKSRCAIHLPQVSLLHLFKRKFTLIAIILLLINWYQIKVISFFKNQYFVFSWIQDWLWWLICRLA